MDIVKKGPVTSPVKVGKKLYSTTSTVEKRIREAQKQQESSDATALPNRIVLLLDCSGSMNSMVTKTQRRIDILKDAVLDFASSCQLGVDSAIGIKTLPDNQTLELETGLHKVHVFSAILEPTGGTPLQEFVERVAREFPLTRAIIVSDGQATDWHPRYDTDEEGSDKGLVEEVKKSKAIEPYLEMQIPIDCIHISEDESGEELLKAIAEATGGIFIKFKDVGKLLRGLRFLTPAARLRLTDGRVSANELGADELKL
jgi:Mg-chelatase subunit ChlD